MLTIYLSGIIAIGLLGTAIWTIFELLLITSFFWAYIDEHRWQLPEKLEWFFFKYYTVILRFSKSEIYDSIYRINGDRWDGRKHDKEEHIGGRFMLATIGLIGRIVVVWAAGTLWPVPIICGLIYFLFWFLLLLPLRSLRFARRSQKAIVKLVKVAHSHKPDGTVKKSGIDRPEF